MPASKNVGLSPQRQQGGYCLGHARPGSRPHTTCTHLSCPSRPHPRPQGCMKHTAERLPSPFFALTQAQPSCRLIWPQECGLNEPLAAPETLGLQTAGYLDDSCHSITGGLAGHRVPLLNPLKSGFAGKCGGPGEQNLLPKGDVVRQRGGAVYLSRGQSSGPDLVWPGSAVACGQC